MTSLPDRLIIIVDHVLQYLPAPQRRALAKRFASPKVPLLFAVYERQERDFATRCAVDPRGVSDTELEELGVMEVPTPRARGRCRFGGPVPNMRFLLCLRYRKCFVCGKYTIEEMGGERPGGDREWDRAMMQQVLTAEVQVYPETERLPKAMEQQFDHDLGHTMWMPMLICGFCSRYISVD